MNDVYFIGMDIAEETKILMDFTESVATNNMTDNESKAYMMGVKNTLSALKSVLETEHREFVVNIPGLEIQEEFDIADLEHYLRSL
jgi:hypothetical protein